MDKRVKKAIIIVATIVAVNVGLTFAKLYVGLATNSICVLLDATNSFFDIITGVITVFAFALLLKPHKLGYGRAEYLATFLVAAASLIFGAFFAYRSFGRLTMPEPVRSDSLSIILISIAVPVKIAIAVFVKLVNKKLDSPALKAISVDSFLDAGVTFASLLSFTLSAKIEYTVDAIFGIAVSVFVIIAALKLLKEYTLRLFVGEDDEKTKTKLIEAVEKCDKVSRVADAVLHDYGYSKTIADVQVVFASNDYSEVLEASSAIKDRIMEITGIKANIIPVSDMTEKGGKEDAQT